MHVKIAGKHDIRDGLFANISWLIHLVSMKQQERVGGQLLELFGVFWEKFHHHLFVRGAGVKRLLSILCKQSLHQV